MVVDLNASGSGLFNSLNATTSSDADTFNATTNYSVQNTQVVGPQDTGWTAPTATQSKAGFGNGATATEIEQNLSAVINALMSHGLLGS